jgi:hypothetical protein
LISKSESILCFTVLIFASRRRQFYRKISDWGFEKNIKTNEMRALVEDLNERGNNNADLAVELRGHQVDPAKIHRWQKRHGKGKDIARSFPGHPSTGKP